MLISQRVTLVIYVDCSCFHNKQISYLWYLWFGFCDVGSPSTRISSLRGNKQALYNTVPIKKASVWMTLYASGWKAKVCVSDDAILYHREVTLQLYINFAKRSTLFRSVHKSVAVTQPILHLARHVVFTLRVAAAVNQIRPTRCQRQRQVQRLYLYPFNVMPDAIN